MNKWEQFKALLEFESEEYFIGFGNPESDTLILGKECARTKDKDDDKDDYWAPTVFQNKQQWKQYEKGKAIPQCVFMDRDPDIDKFSPRFPFKGQVNKWYHVKRVHNKGEKEKEWTEYCGKGGTSLTWLRYQRLVDLMAGREEPLPKDHELTFLDECFISELSAIPRSFGKLCDETRQSIQKRINNLFNQSFFQSFPIVIAACKGYVNPMRLDIEAIFPNSKIILCNQLSIGVSENMLRDIAEKLKTAEKGKIVRI